MSGALAAMMTTANGRYIVTIGQFSPATDYNGFDSGIPPDSGSARGSLSPPTPVTYKGATIYWIAAANVVAANSIDFEVHLSGSRAQGFFTGIRVLDGTGATRTLLTSN